MSDERRVAILVLLLFLVLVTAYPVKAQSLTGSIGPLPGQTIRRPKYQFANAPSVALNLTQSNFRAYDNGVEQIMETFRIGNAPLSAAMQAAPRSAMPPGTFGLSPIAGTPQTPTSEALRAGNIDVGALAVWVVKHASASRIGGSAARR
jgi:hypothetical protein